LYINVDSKDTLIETRVCVWQLFTHLTSESPLCPQWW